MRLAGDEPRMLLLWQLDHFHQQVVHRLAGNHQAQILERLAITVVELVAMAMALTHHVLAVQLARQRAGLQSALLGTQAHGAAHVGTLVALLDVTSSGGPFGDQRDNRIRCVAVVLTGIGLGETSHVAGEIDHRRMHAVADAEVRHATFPRVSGGQNLSLETALAETARHQDRVDARQRLGGTVGLDLLGIDPMQVDPGLLFDTAMAQRFAK